jgi:hypothetical protein
VRVCVCAVCVERVFIGYWNWGDYQVNKYQRTIRSETVDVYDVLVAFGVTCPATAHAIKKLLMPGTRGHKDKLQDLNEAKQSIERAIELI